VALYAAKIMGARTYARPGEVAGLVAAIREEERAALQRLKEEWLLKECAAREAYRRASQSLAREQRGPCRPGQRARCEGRNADHQGWD
jgi:hypothetical protein